MSEKHIYWEFRDKKQYLAKRATVTFEIDDLALTIEFKRNTIQISATGEPMTITPLGANRIEVSGA